MKLKQALVVLTFIALVMSVFSVILQLTLVSDLSIGRDLTAKASAAGIASICLNHPPSVNFTCNTTVDQNDNYQCQINWTDVDGDIVTFDFSFISGGQVIFNISSSGYINFTPTNDHVGSYSIAISVDDNTNCTNSEANTTTAFTVVNVNDPPYLVQNISDVDVPVNSSISAFFLSSYFADPDGDALTYNSTIPSGVVVTIAPSSEVIFSSSTCNEDGVTMKFFATDPFGEEAESNIVTIRVPCAEPDSGSGEGETGAGGGGGAGSSAICDNKWICQDWFPCLPTGVQWQRCYDERGCDDDRHFKRACEYTGAPPACLENWLCGEWGPCYPNSTQYRECNDLSFCGTELVRPSSEQSCVYIPTCFDGIQNGDETGVDCGGSCSSCALLEQPAVIPPPPWLSTWLLIVILLSILLMAGILRYYKSQIAQGIAALGFMLRHRLYKEILLTADQRLSIFESVGILERHLAMTPDKDLDVEAVYDKLSNLIRGYFVDALNLPVEMSAGEVHEKINKLGLLEETAAILVGIFNKLELIEHEELEYDPYFVKASLEELRTMVCLTSDYDHAEITRDIEDIQITEEMSFYDEIFVRSMNVMRAVQFGQNETAKQEYYKLLQIYDPLLETEKEEIYPEIKWLFHSTKFASEVTGSKIVKKI